MQNQKKKLFGSSIRPNISKSSFDDRVRNLNASFQLNEFDLGVAFMCIYANVFRRREEVNEIMSAYTSCSLRANCIYILYYTVQGQRCYQPFPYIIPDINSILKTRIYPFYKRRVLYISEQTQ